MGRRSICGRFAPPIAHGLLDFFEGLSPESRYFRFFTRPRLTDDTIREIVL